MSYFRMTQRIRFEITKFLLVVMSMVSIYIFFFKQRESTGLDVHVGDGRANVPVTMQDYWNNLDKAHRYSFDLPTATSILLEKNLTEYLAVLQHGVQLVLLPQHLSLGVIHHCDHLGKPPLMLHQHALEITFPKTLREMSRYSLVSSLMEWRFDPLWINVDNVEGSKNGTASLQLRDAKDDEDGPILSYVEAYPYHAVYCTKKSNNKDPYSSREDWTRRDPYWNAVADYLVSLPAWKSNMGTDFIAPASHPQLRPAKRHPHRINYLHRLTFLSTDMDVSGSAPKDIVVPYMTEVSLAQKQFRNGPKKFLLYFAGGDNPKQGLRTRLDEQFKALEPPDDAGVRFALAGASTNGNDRDRVEDYLDNMASSQFCLVVRGDTASSRRYFTAVALGCIPVVVSDWIELPFKRLIDYKQFSFTFPESISSNAALLREMVSFLRSVPQETISKMQAALKQARHLLLIPQLDGANGLVEVTHGAVLNPVTLTLIEALMTRIDYCSAQVLKRSLPLCERIRKRLAKRF